MLRNLVGGSLVIGLLAYVAWSYYTVTIVVLCFIFLVTIPVVLFNRDTNGSFWGRNRAGRARENRWVFVGLIALGCALFLLVTGREEVGAIGAALLVVVGLIIVFAVTVGHD